MKKVAPSFSADDRKGLGNLYISPNIYMMDKERIARALAYIEYLEKEVASYQRTMENINEALNSGDGSYRP